MTQRWYSPISLGFLTPLLALAGLAGVAPAESTDAPHRHGSWRHGPPPIDGVLERHADELDLDAETRERIHGLAEQAREASEPLDAELSELHDGMRALLGQDSPSADAVMQQAERIGSTETAMHKRRLATMLEIRALLTPEQRAKLVQIFEARRERWHASASGDPAAGPGCEAADGAR